MPDSLLQLEAQRTDLFRQLLALGDFRRAPLPPLQVSAGSRAVIAPNATIPATAPTFG